MFGPKELDLRNTYNPNLQDIQESAERTYGAANIFYGKEELFLQDVERRIESGELSSDKDIYDICHVTASVLAECCEMFLKAMYIYEHNIPNNQIDELWAKLKNAEYETDERGNLIYKTISGEITFVKYDDGGNPLKDSRGKIIYFDQNGNEYNENNRGSKIKRSGHQLDRLIGLLSPESRLLLETRMLTIPMETTEKNTSVSILDVLLRKGVLSQINKITPEQYNGWIEQHKKAFEEARYSGQKKTDVSVEFLYHLATQIKAVAQYKMDPKNNQKFTITDEEIAKLPKEIQQMTSFYQYLMSEDLVKLIANNEEIKNKILSLYSEKYIFPKNLPPSVFYNMIILMDAKEIVYVSHLCYLLQHYDELQAKVINCEIDSKAVKKLDVAKVLKMMGVTPLRLLGYFIQIKGVFDGKIYISDKTIYQLLNLLLDILTQQYYEYSDKDYNNYLKDNSSIDEKNINNIFNL